MARRRRPLTPAKIAVRTFQYATLVLASFLVLAPLYSVLVGALKTPLEYINTSKMTPPGNWLNFENCQRRSKNRPMGGAKVGHLWRAHETRGMA